MRPRSNTECVREVCQRINLYCCKDLEDLIRLRNIITHRYWMVKDDQIYRDIKNDFECIIEFIRKVEELSSV
ncbi:HepT-like ribonuclease domain-containing protein [Thermofilum sp.]|uniref:HepT-like ribonuclease domain-containing protein n=1 Tax=Thermofilum sp. TaxID=1961369 RepID=UPI00386C1632